MVVSIDVSLVFFCWCFGLFLGICERYVLCCFVEFQGISGGDVACVGECW